MPVRGGRLKWVAAHRWTGLQADRHTIADPYLCNSTTTLGKICPIWQNHCNFLTNNVILNPRGFIILLICAKQSILWQFAVSLSVKAWRHRKGLKGRGARTLRCPKPESGHAIKLLTYQIMGYIYTTPIIRKKIIVIPIAKR